MKIFPGWIPDDDGLPDGQNFSYFISAEQETFKTEPVDDNSHLNSVIQEVVDGGRLDTDKSGEKWKYGRRNDESESQSSSSQESDSATVKIPFAEQTPAERKKELDRIRQRKFRLKLVAEGKMEEVREKQKLQMRERRGKLREEAEAMQSAFESQLGLSAFNDLFGEESSVEGSRKLNAIRIRNWRSR